MLVELVLAAVLLALLGLVLAVSNLPGPAPEVRSVPPVAPKVAAQRAAQVVDKATVTGAAQEAAASATLEAAADEAAGGDTDAAGLSGSVDDAGL